MARKPADILADALEEASNAAVNHIVNSKHLLGTNRTRLIKQGYLKPIIRGWYLLDADLTVTETGNSVLWQECYWDFIAQYLQERLADQYIVSPEQSLDILTGGNLCPTQLLVSNLSKKNDIVKLPRSLSVSMFSAQSLPDQIELFQGVRIHTLEDALIKVGPLFFRNQPNEAIIALTTADHSKVLAKLLDTGNVSAASRLIGAYQAIGQSDVANDISDAMKLAGYGFTETNPFDSPVQAFTANRQRSPYAVRIELLWGEYRSLILNSLNGQYGKAVDFDLDKALEQVESNYVNDAYNSLSIEGYKVTPGLISQIRSGDWDPEKRDRDAQQLDAMAAKGYWDAHNAVKGTIRYFVKNGITEQDLRSHLSGWYRAMFGPMVQAGMLKASDLAGYRNRPVFIRGSRHTPLPVESLLDAMEALFGLVAKETHPIIAATLGHFFIGYIHPFPDGNGRCARFLMNALLVANGYPWTIIKLEDRKEYMAALESLSVGKDPIPFSKFIIRSMTNSAHTQQ